MVAPSLSFDDRALVDPVDPAEARAFVKQWRRSGGLSSTLGGSTVVSAFVIGVTVMSVALLLTAIAALTSPGNARLGNVWIRILPFVIFAVMVAVGLVVVLAARRSTAERMLRLDRFARANGMSYLPRLGAPALPGMIFSVGDARMASDLVRGEQPRFVEFANYRYTTGSGKNKTAHPWGYVAIKLDVPLPHIVLDATGNNGLLGSNLPHAFEKDQRLSLEGDFDRHFALYCPEGYERDALYLFTPDIMARFIDNAAALDVEIVDDWLFLYAKRDFSTLDPATWAWLFSVVGALLDKFAQWARWRDERLTADPTTDAAAALRPDTRAPATATEPGGATSVPFAAPLDDLRPPPGVAAPGRRLQKGVPWTSFVLAGAVVLIWTLVNTGFFGLFWR
jgi:hypothetical protein